MVEPAYFKNVIIKIVDFIYQDPTTVLIVLVVFAVLAWFIMKPALNFDDSIWTSITFIFGVLIIMSFLFMVQKGFINIDLKLIWQKLLSLF